MTINKGSVPFSVAGSFQWANMHHSCTLTLSDMDGAEYFLVLLVFTLLFDVKMATLKKGPLSPRTLHHALQQVETVTPGF